MLWVSPSVGVGADEEHPGSPAAAGASADASHAKGKGATPEEGGHGSEPEAPLGWKADLALWSLIVFLLFIAILGKFAWRPLIQGLNERELGIRQHIAAAEEARLKAEQMLADHAAKLDKVQDEVREIVAEARRDAEHTKHQIISEAQSEAEATKKRSILEIERAKDGALKELFDAMAGQVASATEHVLARSLTDQDRNRLIDEALAQLPRNGK